jgi:hypothetical protein
MTRQTGEWSCGDLTPEDLPAGKYLVSYRTWEKRSYWNQLKIRLDFVIVEPAAFAGLVVSLYATCTLNPNKRHSRASKYYQLWVQAHEGPPQRGQRMTPSVFEGYWTVEVAWGRTKTGEPTIPKIEQLLERVAGGRGVT